jgi:uncharacterized protein YbaR (Trm112 family)
MNFMIAKDLLKILACPKCKGDVKEQGMFIVCNSCKLAYPVLDGNVPDMLIDDAWPLEKARKAGFKHKLKL